MSVQHTDLHVLYFNTCTCTKGPEGAYRLTVHELRPEGVFLT